MDTAKGGKAPLVSVCCNTNTLAQWLGVILVLGHYVVKTDGILRHVIVRPKEDNFSSSFFNLTLGFKKNIVKLYSCLSV